MQRLVQQSLDAVNRLNGDVATALTTVDEAITIATARHARVPECLGRIVRAEILSKSKANDQRTAAAEERSRAAALMQETGALIFEKFINGTDAETKTPMPKQMPPFAG